MQNHTIRLKNLQNEVKLVKIPIDFTLYEARKEAARLCGYPPSQPSNPFDVFLNGQRVIDLTRKIYQLTRDSFAVIEFIEKQYVKNDEYHYQTKAQFVISWEGVSYNVAVSKQATILDLKNKITEMLGLEGIYYVRYAEVEVPSGEPVSKYILCNNLKLEKVPNSQKISKIKKPENNSSALFDKGARLVESVASSEKENRDADLDGLDVNTQNSSNYVVSAHQMKKSNIEHKLSDLGMKNSLKDSVREDETHMKSSSINLKNHPRLILKKSCTSMNSSNIMVQSEKKLPLNNESQQVLVSSQPQKVSLSTLARQLESEATETYSINSSTESDLLDFEELFINFVNEEETRCYTLECNREMQLLKAVQKLAKLQRVPVHTVILYHFEGKRSKLSTSRSRFIDKTKLAPEKLKVFQLADPKHKQHTILYRLATEAELKRSRDRFIQSTLKHEKENYNTSNKSSTIISSEKTEERTICPETVQN